jgi:hypothetical protein
LLFVVKYTFNKSPTAKFADEFQYPPDVAVPLIVTVIAVALLSEAPVVAFLHTVTVKLFPTPGAVPQLTDNPATINGCWIRY